MLSFARRHILGLIAIVIALSGTAYAANTVRSTDIVNGQVMTQDLANRAVTPAKTTFRMDTRYNTQQSTDCYGGPGQWRYCAPVNVELPAGYWVVKVTSTVQFDPGNSTVSSQFCPATPGPTCISSPNWATFFPRGVTSSTWTEGLIVSSKSFSTFSYGTAARFSGPGLNDAYVETVVDVFNEDFEAAP